MNTAIICSVFLCELLSIEGLQRAEKENAAYGRVIPSQRDRERKSFLLFSTALFAEPINVYVNNKKLELTTNPQVINDHTLVPLRDIFESLGVIVEWDQATKTVTGKIQDREIKLIINNKIALVNGTKVELEVPAIAINGRTMVPARFVAESLGAVVEWYVNTKSVLVNSRLPYGKHKVLRVIDGDTIEVNYNGTVEKVRLIGVDTPESVHPDAKKNVPEGIIASDFTKSKLEEKEVALEFDIQSRDQYGRLLAYVWYSGEIFNKVLLKEGYAQISTFPPNIKYVDEFRKLQAEAREAKRGLWGNIAAVKKTGK